MELGDVSYQPIRTFQQWTSALEPVPDWTGLDTAVEQLARTRQSMGPTDTELSVRQSLLLAALHTGAVEGLHRMNRGITLTAMDNVTNWERFVEDGEGSEARRHVEAALGAYDLAMDAARPDALPINEAWIRRVHEVACAAQDSVVVRTEVGEQRQTFVRGEYKRIANHVLLADGAVHEYAPPGDVPWEMHRLVEELRQPSFESAHPIVQAAYAHHALAQIHPFQDGNGRVARVLASVPLLRWTSVPFHLYEDQVAEYFDALAAADAGHPGEFARFVRDRTHDLLLLTSDRLAAEGEVEMERSDEHQLAVAITRRLGDVVDETVRTIVDSYSWPAGIRGRASALPPTGASFDSAGRRSVIGVNLLSIDHDESGAFAQRGLQIYADDDSEREYPFALGDGTGEPLQLRFADLHPEIKMTVRTRVDAYLRRIIRETLLELKTKVGSSW